jgi:hypothetical protein
VVADRRAAGRRRRVRVLGIGGADGIGGGCAAGRVAFDGRVRRELELRRGVRRRRAATSRTKLIVGFVPEKTPESLPLDGVTARFHEKR